VDGLPIPVPHSCGARFCLDSLGRQWIRKPADFIGANEVLAETLAWLVARELELPVPCVAVTDGGLPPSVLSARVPYVFHWAPSYAHFLLNADGLGGVLALDVVLHNEDRHMGNILLEPSPDEHHLRAWGIDFGDAIVGWPQDFADLGPEAVPSTRNLARGIPVGLVGEGARRAARSLSRLTATILEQFSAEACLLACEPGGAVLAEGLKARCSAAPELVERYLMGLGTP